MGRCDDQFAVTYQIGSSIRDNAARNTEFLTLAIAEIPSTMSELITLLQEIESGKTSFTPQSPSEEDMRAFQSVTKALIFANEQGYLDRILVHRQSTTRNAWYDSVVVENGLTYKGERFLEQASSHQPPSPISVDTHIELLDLASQNRLPHIIDRKSNVSYQAARELIEAGHLSGVQANSTNGASIIAACITLAGRLFLEERKQHGREAGREGMKPDSSSAMRPVDIASRLLERLQLYEVPGQAEDTKVLKDVSHEELTKAINTFVFHHGVSLGVEGWGDNIQSMRDGGVDSVWRARSDANMLKFGFQVKSWGDINDKQDSLRRKVLSQIAESRQTGLSCLLLVLAADLSNNSQSQKARQLMGEIERMQDNYAYAISPEKTLSVWNWFCRTNLSALEQNRAAGYAAITTVFDSLGNRTEGSAVQGRCSNGSAATTVRAGDIVEFTSAAEAARAEPLEFQFAVQRSGGCFETRQEWNTSSRWTWRISAQDIGKGVFVRVATRHARNYYQFQDADDYVTLVYDVLPPRN